MKIILLVFSLIVFSLSYQNVFADTVSCMTENGMPLVFHHCKVSVDDIGITFYEIKCDEGKFQVLVNNCMVKVE